MHGPPPPPGSLWLLPLCPHPVLSLRVVAPGTICPELLALYPRLGTCGGRVCAGMPRRGVMTLTLALTAQVKKDLQKARSEDDRVTKMLLLTLTLTLTLP